MAFILGSIGLIPVAFNFFLYLQQQATASNSVGYLSNSATYAGFVIAFVIFLLVGFLLLIYIRNAFESNRTG